MNMKKIIMIGIIVFVVICGGWLYYTKTTSNPWNAKTIGEIPTPKGYTRVNAKKGTYADYFRNIPLKEKGTKVMLYTGGEANFQLLSTAVIDKTLLSNYEQCADVTMRLRAEYFWEQGLYNKISFRDVNRNLLQYKGGASRKAFEKYMRKVYGVCSTFSVFHETTPRKITEIKPGDVFVYPARKGRKYGHAVIVVDVAKNESGKIAILCAEGNTPARSMHIVRNQNPFNNPWFFFDEDDEVFWIGPFRFNKNELRHY